MQCARRPLVGRNDILSMMEQESEKGLILVKVSKCGLQTVIFCLTISFPSSISWSYKYEKIYQGLLGQGHSVLELGIGER